MRNIVLAGMPGSGKSTIAKELQKELPNFNLVEIDAEIEKEENCSISEIFKNKGEQYFRQKETEILKKLSNCENLLISLGGGSFDKEENRQLLQKNGIIFFLDCDIEIIFNRIKTETQRPLLNNKNPLGKLNELYNKRIANFKKADIEINANKTANEIVQEIIRKYNARTN